MSLNLYLLVTVDPGGQPLPGAGTRARSGSRAYHGTVWWLLLTDLRRGRAPGAHGHGVGGTGGGPDPSHDNPSLKMRGFVFLQLLGALLSIACGVAGIAPSDAVDLRDVQSLTFRFEGQASHFSFICSFSFVPKTMRVPRAINIHVNFNVRQGKMTTSRRTSSVPQVLHFDRTYQTNMEHCVV